MHNRENEIGFRVYWEDRHGEKQTLYTSGTEESEVVTNSIDYIRNNIYLDSFKIVGLEKAESRQWVKVPMASIWCKGRDSKTA